MKSNKDKDFLGEQYSSSLLDKRNHIDLESDNAYSLNRGSATAKSK